MTELSSALHVSVLAPSAAHVISLMPSAVAGRMSTSSPSLADCDAYSAYVTRRTGSCAMSSGRSAMSTWKSGCSWPVRQFHSSACPRGPRSAPPTDTYEPCASGARASRSVLVLKGLSASKCDE